MKMPSFFRTCAAAAFLAVISAPLAAQMERPEGAIAEHKAEVQRLSDEQANLQKKLDEAYVEIQEAHRQKSEAVIAVIVTLVICTLAMGGFLYFFTRSREKARRELLEMNAKLDRQSRDLASANEELGKVNKELTLTIETIKKNRQTK
ncbi:MAG TPA: hypothetical protein PKI32_08230 [Opitutales bacterium]|nr:hypothetical protein [Opitutales bacterium]